MPFVRKSLAVAALLALLPHGPVQAEASSPSLMERGLEMFLDGLQEGLGPSLTELQELMDQFGPSVRGFLQEMGPALADIAKEVQDWSVYELPEILPNGDIIIRRKPAQPEAPIETSPGDGQIDI